MIIQEEIVPITVQTSSKAVILEQMEPIVEISQDIKQVVIQQEFPANTIQGGSIVAFIKPFSVVATSNGQTVFTLPYTYSQIICLFIMGTGQDPIAGDYTVVGNQVTLGSSAPYIAIGDLIFGSGQI
jgi:hypothetical protein